MDPGTTLKGPCHCCGQNTLYHIQIYGLPDRFFTYWNSLIDGYPGICSGGSNPPGVLDMFPDFPNDEDMRSAVNNASFQFFAFPWDNIPKPWSAPRDLWGTFPSITTPGRLAVRTLVGVPDQTSPGPNGQINNRIDPQDYFWQNDFINTVTGQSFAPLAVFDKCVPRPPLDIDHIHLGVFNGISVIKHPNFGPEYGACDNAMNSLVDGAPNGSFWCPMALCTATRFVGPDFACASFRTLHDYWDGCAAFNASNCRKELIPLAGKIFSQPTQAGYIFQSDGFLGSTDQAWSEGTELWIEPCEDCVCP